MGAKIRSGGRFSVAGQNGQPANGWKVWTFNPGTAGVAGTDDKATYTDYTLATPQTNPVILNARGEAEIWWNGVYLIRVTDANDNLIYTLDYFGQGDDTASDTNVAPLNGSFEADDNGDGVPNNWTITEYTNATVAIDSTDANSGQNCLKFTGTDANGGGTAETDLFNVSPNETRILSFYYYSSAVNTLNSVAVKYYNHAGVLISTVSLYSEGASNPLVWTEKTAVTTTPANAVQASLLITGLNPAGTTKIGSTKFDAVRFNKSVIIIGNETNTVNVLKVTGSATGNAVGLTSEGSDSNIDIEASGKGTGRFKLLDSIVLFDEPINLVNVTASVAWSTITHSQLSNNKATYALLGLQAYGFNNVTSGGSVGVSTVVRNGDSTSTNTARLQKAETTIGQASGAGINIYGEDQNFAIVKLDSSYQFDYYVSITCPSGNAEIDLIGYI